MRAVFFIQSENFSKAKSIVYGDEVVSKQSVNFRESRAMGFDKDGYYLDIDGSGEAISKAKEILADIAKEVGEKEKEEVLSKVKEQEDSAASGFGSLFG